MKNKLITIGLCIALLMGSSCTADEEQLNEINTYSEDTNDDPEFDEEGNPINPRTKG